jgi:hypothetical protein
LTRRFASSAFLAITLLLGMSSAARAQKIDVFMTSVAGAWSRGDVDALASLASKQGIAIEVDGTHVGSISGRQIAAILKRVFEDRRTIRATAGTSRMLPGTSSRAYAEVIWERRARGTTESERVNVFFALAKEKDGWHITEIRLMP